VWIVKDVKRALAFVLSLVVATQPVLAQSRPHHLLDLLSREAFGPDAATQPFGIGGAVQVEAIHASSQDRRLEISVPLPFAPRVTFHRQSYDLYNPFGYAGYRGGVQSLRAALPLGLTLEAGSRINEFDQRHNDFVGLTFRLSDLRLSDGRYASSRRAAYKGAPLPDATPQSSGGFPFLRTAGTLALIGLLAGGGGGGGGGKASPPDDPTDGPPDGSGEWNLVWNDEFDGTALDSRKWSMTDSYGRDPCFGGGNQEQQCYTSSLDNVRVVDGKLVLTARPEAGLEQGRSYTSGRVQSAGKADFTYGKFEARIKLAGGQGSWPAFWMLPTGQSYGSWPLSGEIDIMEAVNLGVDNQAVLGTLHFGAPHRYIGGETTIDDINAFHTFTVEWYPDEMRWSVNGSQYASKIENEWFSSGAIGDANAPFDRDFHMILNLAIGGQLPGPTDGLNFPRQMEVDYVRVYECDGATMSACKAN
jgi:beta-glucanase (GH16 family)